MLFLPHLWSIWFQLHCSDQEELFWCSLLTNIAAFSVLVWWLISSLFVAIFPLAHVSLLSVCRKRGAILNISSASGMYPVPLLTIYSATKVIAIQRSWPFLHLLNWSVIIRHIPPACLLHAAVERSVSCLFSLELCSQHSALSPCLRPVLPEWGHVSSAPAPNASSIVPGLVCRSDAEASSGWWGGRLAFSLSPTGPLLVYPWGRFVIVLLEFWTLVLLFCCYVFLLCLSSPHWDSLSQGNTKQVRQWIKKN